MKRNHIVATAVAMTLCTPAAFAANDPLLNPLETVTTADGNSYIYRYLPTTKRIAIAVSWPAPFELMRPGREGLAFLVPRLMLQAGTIDKSSAEMKEEFKDLGSGFALRTRAEWVDGYFVAPAEKAMTGAGLINDVLVRPSLSKVWLQRLKANFQRMNAQFLVKAGAKAALVGRRYSVNDHPYFNTGPFSPISVLTSISQEDVKAWHRNAFVRRGAKIVVTGSAPKSAISPIVDRLLKGLPEKPQDNWTRSVLPSYRLDGKTIVLVDPSAKKSAVIMAARLPGPKRTNDVLTGLSVHLLGRGAQSRLFQALRSQLGAAYRIGASAKPLRLRERLLLIRTEIETAKLATGVTTLHAAYAKFVKEGVTAAELDAGRRRLLLGLKKHLSQPRTSSPAIMATQKLGRPLDYLHNIEPRLGATTSDMLNQHIANAFPLLEKTLTIIVTPNAKGIKADCTIDKIEKVANCG